MDWAGHKDLQPPQGSAGPRRGKLLLPIADVATVEAGWDNVFGSNTFHERTNF